MALSSRLRNLGEYNKAIAAVIGSALVVLTAILGFAEVLPEAVAGWAATALAFLTALSVYLVRNQDAIDKFGDSVADILDRK